MMKITELPQIFIDALPVLKQLEISGYEAYFVGGSVRDLMLHRHIHDIDIATSAYPEEVKETFDKTIDTGIKHGTVTVLYNGQSYEITTFRTESEYQDFRRPDHVTFVQSLEEDLKRRDFTINALAMNTKGEIIDLFNGLTDLDNKLVKAVGNPEKRFHEDALRMMRAVRFVSQLKFSLEQHTEAAILQHHKLLSKISIERVREEFVKLGLGPNSREAFQMFMDTKLSEEVPYMEGKQHLLEVYPKLQFSPSEETSLWSIIIILLKLQNDQISKFMRAWKNSNAMSDEVEKIVNFFDLLSETSPSDYQLFEVGKTTLLNTIDVAHILGQPIDSKVLVDRYMALPIKHNDELAIDGNFLIKLGITPGPHLGKILEDVKKQVIAGLLENDIDEIKSYIKKVM